MIQRTGIYGASLAKDFVTTPLLGDFAQRFLPLINGQHILLEYILFNHKPIVSSSLVFSDVFSPSFLGSFWNKVFKKNLVWMNQAFLEEYFYMWILLEHIYYHYSSFWLGRYNFKMAREYGKDFLCPAFGNNLEQCNLIKMLLIISYRRGALYNTVVPWGNTSLSTSLPHATSFRYYS